MLKRILSALILASMLVSMAACGGAETPSDTSADPNPTDTSAGADTEPARQMPDVEKCDYEGEEFNIFAPSWSLYTSYYNAEEETGETMDDAIYKRQRLVEEYLGVTINYTLEGTITDQAGAMQGWVMSGEDPYQMTLTHCIYGPGAMVASNLLYDWNELPHINMDREYWSQTINDALELFGKQYFAVSDYMYKIPYCMYFNKDLIADYSLENPYELVREGKWTIDKMFEMASVALKDVNGDNVYDNRDQFGFCGQADSPLISFMYSCGLSLTTRTEDGGFELAIKNDKMLNLLDKLDKAINDEEFCQLWPYSGATPEQTCSFKDGQSLFTMGGTDGLKGTREWELDFGILPYPKYDEEQEKYLNNDWGGFMAIPINISNPEMVGKVLEMLAYYSGETTLPAYYEVMMGEKFARDEDAKEMLELILSNENVVYDAGYVYGGISTGYMLNLFYMIPRMIWGTGENTFASWYDTYAPTAEWDMKDFLAKVEAQAE